MHLRAHRRGNRERELCESSHLRGHRRHTSSQCRQPRTAHDARRAHLPRWKKERRPLARAASPPPQGRAVGIHQARASSIRFHEKGTTVRFSSCTISVKMPALLAELMTGIIARPES